jgi:hypothetical protein
VLCRGQERIRSLAPGIDGDLIAVDSRRDGQPHPRSASLGRTGARTMIRIELDVELSYEIDERGADFVFNIHAAHTRS